MKNHKIKGVMRTALSLLLTVVMLIGIMPIASIAEFDSDDQKEYLHGTQPGVEVEKAYTVCTGDHVHDRVKSDGQGEVEDTLGPSADEDTGHWDLNSNHYQDDYFAVMYKMNITPTKGIYENNGTQDNGACGIVIGGEDFACAYIRYDGNNGSQKTTNYELTFGPYWSVKYHRSDRLQPLIFAIILTTNTTARSRSLSSVHMPMKKTTTIKTKVNGPQNLTRIIKFYVSKLM